MSKKETFIRRKEELLNDKSICKENRIIFKKFFEFEEHKLKRQNSLPQLDEPCYKTLDYYITKLRNVNSWFKNKPWKKLTKKDIEKVYNDLEDGVIKTANGKRFEDLKSYYGKVLKSKPFQLAGKDILVKEVIQFTRKNKEEVKFLDETNYKKMVGVIVKPTHKGITKVGWDIGESLGGLLQLTKNDFYRQINEHTKEPEYRINLPKDKLKRARQTRSEITNYRETVKILDIILKDLKENELVFKFGEGAVKKFFDRAAKLSGAISTPKGLKPTFKDLRSGMVCYLAGTQNWTREELNARLGHVPSSKEIDKYLNFIAYNKKEPKKKIYENDLRKVVGELEETKQIVIHQETKNKLFNDKINLNDKRFEKILKFFEKYPEVANEMIKKDKKAVMEIFNED